MERGPKPRKVTSEVMIIDIQILDCSTPENRPRLWHKSRVGCLLLVWVESL